MQTAFSKRHYPHHFPSSNTESFSFIKLPRLRHQAHLTRSKESNFQQLSHKPSMAATTAAERPPSPPNSNDGDFGLAESSELVVFQGTHQDDAGDAKYAPRSIRPAPVNHHHLVSTSCLRRTTVTWEADTPQDQYGDPSHYQTAPSQEYYATSQPVSRPPQPGTLKKC